MSHLPFAQIREFVVFVLLLLAGNASAESFMALPLQARSVGPTIIGQTSPAPPGGWQASDNRQLNAALIGQGGWTGTCSNANYDEEITAGVAHSGGHGWRLSNWYHDGCVNHVIGPAFAPTGEVGSTTIINGGGVGPATNSIVYEFWFRSASTSAEPGTYLSTTISDYDGRRMTYLGFFDELPSTDNGCPGDGNCFHLDASGVTDGGQLGTIDTTDSTVHFDDHYSPPLTRGVWYRVHIDATFNDTVDEGTRRNDVVNYRLYDAAGNEVWHALGVNTWEDAYYQGHYGSHAGDKVATTNIAYRISADPDSGTQSNGDSYAATHRPHGIVFDDLSVQPVGQASYKTSFDFDRYVATTGNNNTDCSNAALPCKTITYAIAQSNPYDTIHVAAGVYAENSAGSQNLIVDKPVAIEGAKVGVDARTRDLSGSDVGETVLVPALSDSGLTVDSLGDVAVVNLTVSGASIDGVVIDGDNPLVTSPLTLNGTNPDADTGILADGGNFTVQNTIIRNVTGAGFLAYNTAPGGDSLISLNRFANITNPTSWGIGVYAGNNFYAQITDNLMNQVRVGIQFAENDSQADPGTQPPAVSRNEVHATRIGLFFNLFYADATTWKVSDNHIFAAVNAAQTGQWRGIQIESMQSAQTATITGNVIDGSALAGVRSTAGYVLNNWVSTQSANTAIDGGSVSGTDVGVLVTDATNYTGPVNGSLITNIAFSNIALGAVYAEDTNEVAGSAATTIGTGNTYTNVLHQLVLSGTSPSVSFSGIAGVDDVLVRSLGNYLYGNLNSGPCSAALCTVANASINAGIAAVNVGGTVNIEHGTFDEMAVVGTGKDGVRVTSVDPNNPATLIRTTGGPNQPVMVVAGTPIGAAGPAPQSVSIDHLNFVVDKAHAGEGLLVSGFVDGMSIHDNTFLQSYSGGPSAAYKYTNAISINIDPQHNSLGTPRVDGSFVSIDNNTIGGSSAPPTTFRAGIAMDAGVGSITNNHSAGLNHDAIVRFATVVPGGSNGVTIDSNTFTGGGLEFDAPNAGITPITISNNTIAAQSTPPALLSPFLGLPQTIVEADISAFRLIDNYQHLPVSVSGNHFSGYANGYRGALVQNFPNTTFADNVFTPQTGASDFVSLVVSNKEINTDNPAEPPYPMSITALRNTFNGSNVAGAGRAVEFINDNDANGSASFGLLTFGDATAANANTFDGAHQYYFNLVDQNCDTVATPCTFLNYAGVGTLQNTQVRAFSGNVFAINNLFDGVAPHAMSPLQQTQLNQQTNDINDDVALGYVNYGFTGAVVLALKGPVANVQVAVPADYAAEVTNTGTTLDENVLVHFTVSRTMGVSASDLTLQYFDGATYQTIALTPCNGTELCGTFGPQPNGFPLPVGSIQTPLRTMYNVPDTYTVSAAVRGVDTNVVYAANTISTQVVQSAAHLGLALSGPTVANPGTAVPGYAARLTNTGGATTENVLVHFAVSRGAGIGTGDIDIQYFNGTTYQSIPLSLCNGNTQLCGTFGPQPAGFPIGVGYDQTTQLHVTYQVADTYTIDAGVDGVTTVTSYATATQQIVVTAIPPVATNIAPNGPTTFTGTAGAVASQLPSVIVTDSGGHPVPGYSITFVAGPNSGTLFGTTQLTDINGIATLGGWVYGTTSTETVTVTAPLTGSPITFTATVSAHIDLEVDISTNSQFVQYGHTLDYVIIVSNAGPSTSTNQITDNLPPELDVAGAVWTCVGHTIGATCSSGTGNLSDTPTIPANGNVVYQLSATVLINSPDEMVLNQASAATTDDSNPANNTASASTQIVIFRDGFEPGGNGAQSNAFDAGTLDDNSTLALDPSTAPQASYMPVTWIRVIDAKGRNVFRIEVVQATSGKLVRQVSSDGVGNETRSAWIPAQRFTINLSSTSGGATQATLLGSNTALTWALPTWAALPLQVFASQ